MRIECCRKIEHVYQLTAPRGRKVNNRLVNNAFMIIGVEPKCCTYLVVLRDKLVELVNVLGIAY